MAADRRRLDPAFSLYLDLVRFFAAFLVVLTHCRQYGLVSGWAAKLLPDAGRESVILFFVLSGFVIAWSTMSKLVSARDYFAARLTRIWSVALPVILLAFALAFLTARMAGPGLVPGYMLDRAWLYIPLHLLFMGQVWTLSETPPWLEPYWSLGYEVWYYVLFGVLFYLRGLPRALAAGLVLAVTGYKLWLLLPVWAAGIWLVRWLDRHTLPLSAARTGCLASALLLAAYNVAHLEVPLREAAAALWPFASLPLGSADRVLADYLVGTLVVVNFACARYSGFTGLARFAGAIRRLSFFSFPLYLAHALVLGIWGAFHPDQRGGGADLLAVAAAVMAFTWVLGHGAERLRIAALGWIDFADPLARQEEVTLRPIGANTKREYP